MTSDAKVGLLLGLVFIFIIAFVINGLPQFHKTETPTNVLTVASPGKNIELAEYQKEQTRLFTPEKISTPKQASANQAVTEPVVQTPAASSAPIETSQQTQIAANTDNTTRFSIPLPRASASQTIPTPAAAAQVAIQTNIQPSQAQQPSIIQTLTSNEQSQQQKVEPVIDPSAKTYTVKKGDSLSKIAQKFYGPEEGLKNSNISRIYQANRITMKSSDNLKIGMELIIPSLPSTPQRDIPATAFEEVQSITPAVVPAEKTQAKFREITIKERDSLWQIAAKNLGDGRRFTEIIKLNSDVLGGTNRLKVGMKLRLPEK